MNRGLIEEQSKGGSEAWRCLIQWDAPGVGALAHFNCAPPLWKGVASDGALMNLEKAGYSVPPSYTLEDNGIVLVRPTCFWHRTVALAWQLNTLTDAIRRIIHK